MNDSQVNPFASRFKKCIIPTLEKYTSEIVRIGSIIIFHLSKLWKAKFFFILCEVIFQARLQGNWSLLGVIVLKWVSILIVVTRKTFVWVGLRNVSPEQAAINYYTSELNWTRSSGAEYSTVNSTFGRGDFTPIVTKKIILFFIGLCTPAVLRS